MPGIADVRMLPEVIAKGKISRHPSDPQKREIKLGNKVVVMLKKRKSSAWVLTSYSKGGRP